MRTHACSALSLTDALLAVACDKLARLTVWNSVEWRNCDSVPSSAYCAPKPVCIYNAICAIYDLITVMTNLIDHSGLSIAFQTRRRCFTRLTSWHNQLIAHFAWLSVQTVKVVTVSADSRRWTKCTVVDELTALPTRYWPDFRHWIQSEPSWTRNACVFVRTVRATWMDVWTRLTFESCRVKKKQRHTNITLPCDCAALTVQKIVSFVTKTLIGCGTEKIPCFADIASGWGSAFGASRHRRWAQGAWCWRHSWVQIRSISAYWTVRTVHTGCASDDLHIA